jgi:hypothetical protein
MAQYLPPTILEQLKEAVVLFDMDKNGLLTYREFRLIMSTFVYDTTGEELLRVKKICDENPSGISAEEAIDCAARIWLVRNATNNDESADEVTDATPLDLDEICDQVMIENGLKQTDKEKTPKPKKKGFFVSTSESNDSAVEEYLARKRRAQ